MRLHGSFFLLLALSALRLSADTIGLSSQVTASIGWSPNTLGCPVVGPITDTTLVNIPRHTCGILYQGIFSSQYADAFAAATPQWGNLQLSVVTEMSGPSECGDCRPAGMASATAFASFTDTMTIYGGTGTANLLWTYQESTTTLFGVIPVVNIALPSQVQFGVPFTISASLSLSAANNYVYFTERGDGHFLLTGLQVNGGYNYLYSDGSGYNYAIESAAPVPEPSYFGLMAAIFGLGPIAARRWRAVRRPF